MEKLFDKTTSGAKRVDWMFDSSDLTHEEFIEWQTMFQPWLEKVLAKRPFGNDIEDLDYWFEVNVTGKWHDEFPDYSHIKCKESWQC
tara:strand:+ start:29 stop:289 length:261 start_codon:yes stop_codon:yes gene_type:complete